MTYIFVDLELICCNERKHLVLRNVPNTIKFFVYLILSFVYAYTYYQLFSYRHSCGENRVRTRIRAFKICRTLRPVAGSYLRVAPMCAPEDKRILSFFWVGLTYFLCLLSRSIGRAA